jgi:hypothetical protein
MVVLVNIHNEQTHRWEGAVSLHLEDTLSVNFPDFYYHPQPESYRNQQGWEKGKVRGSHQHIGKLARCTKSIHLAEEHENLVFVA